MTLLEEIVLLWLDCVGTKDSERVHCSAIIIAVIFIVRLYVVYMQFLRIILNVSYCNQDKYNTS